MILTKEQFERKYGPGSTSQWDNFNNIPAEEPTFISGALSSLKESFKKGKAQIQGTGEFEGSTAPVRGTQLAGTLAMTVPSAVMGGISAVTPEPIKEGLKEYVAEPVGKVFSAVSGKISDKIDEPTQYMSQVSNKLIEDALDMRRRAKEETNPQKRELFLNTAEGMESASQEITKNISSTEKRLGTLSGIPKVTKALSETASGLLATQGMAKTAMGAVNTAQKGIGAVSNIKNIIPPGGGGSGVVSNIIKKTTDTARGVRDVIKPIVEEVKTLPGKAKVNLADIRAKESIIGKLKPAGQTAVRSGVELSDVKSLYNLPKNISTKLKPLVKSVQDFASGKSTANPLEMVGKPIVKAFKTAQSKASSIGAKLGKVADSLEKVTPKQTFPKVFAQLKKVSGLNGLKVNSKGILDFSGTNLASALSKADRVAIQKIFTDAIKAGTGKSKHLYRQELFNILGGKKTGLAGLSGTQEQAFNAIRKGLSDVLDDLNPTYKALNTQFAKAMSPISKLQKLLKSAGMDEDLANMNAGLLARRLTSFSKSNPEIRQILRDLDIVNGTVGKTTLNVEKLQDFYNILDKYYDIAGRTGFQGQVTAGVEKAIGGNQISRVVNLAEEKVTKVFGETDIVKQKALEEILKELFD